MAIWNCPSCGEDNDSDFGICWNCGDEKDAGRGVERIDDEGLTLDDEDDAPAPRSLDCPRCGASMQPIGRVRFREDTRLRPVIQGALGELLLNRESLDAYACSAPACGKVELFAITLAEISRDD